MEDLWQQNNYSILYNSSVSGKKLWRLVRIKRQVELQLRSAPMSEDKVEAGVRQLGSPAVVGSLRR